MFCLYKGCSKKVKALCQNCLVNRYLCEEHTWVHNNELNHIFTLIDEAYIRKMINKQLISKIENCIAQITSDTNKIISEITKASRNAINFLKSLNSNLDDIRQFTQVVFRSEQVIYLIEKVRLICEDMQISPESEVEEVSVESNFHGKKIEEPIEIIRPVSQLIFRDQVDQNKNFRANINQITNISPRNQPVINDFGVNINQGGELSPRNKTRINHIEMILRDKCFNQMEIYWKMDYMKKNWSFIKLKHDYPLQILLSNNCAYLFSCNIH